MIIFSFALKRLFKKHRILFITILIFYTLLSCITYYYFRKYYNFLNFGMIDKYIKYFILGVGFLTIICLLVGTIFLFGLPIQRLFIEHNLKDVIYMKKNIFRPYLIDREKKGNGEILTFYSRIPLEVFKEKTGETETAINRKIFEYRDDGSPRITNMCVGDLKKFKKKKLIWKNSMCNKGNTEFVLGESCFETISIDVRKSNGFLVSGGSGSGKGVLCRTLIMQAILKKYLTYVLDISGGTDYYMFNKYNTKFATDMDSIREALEEIINLRDERYRLFKETNTFDLYDYNEKFNKDLPLVFVFFDEYAQFMNRKEIDKTEAEKVKEVEAMMKDLASNSRKAGVNICIALQVADANTVNRLIKDNLNNKMVGRCDKYSSEMVIGDDRASYLINSDDVGMFVHKEKGLFKSYYFDSNSM